MTLQEQIEQGLSNVKSELQESINVLSIQQQSLSDRLYAIETMNTGPTILTKLQFENRFTFDELVAIETAAETNPGIRVLQKKQAKADFIDLTDENTILGVMFLNSVNLLTQERMTEILATGIEPVPEPEPEPEPEPVP
jgi:hypothetical protein